MKLSQEAIQEFKEIYLQEFGEELSDEDAERRARQLLTFYEVVAAILVRERAAIDTSDPMPRQLDENVGGLRVESEEFAPPAITTISPTNEPGRS